jgi:hypothetical protein
MALGVAHEDFQGAGSGGFEDMSYAEYGRGMLDYVQKTCDSVKSVDYAAVPSGNKSVQALFPDENTDFDGEFHPDPEQVAAVAEGLKRPVYNGEMRCVNLGPAKVKSLLATETDPAEREALTYAFDFWSRNGGYAKNPEDLGWVHRGEPREAIHTTMQDIHANLDPVRWEMESMGTLSAQGNGPRCPVGDGDDEGLSLGDELEIALDSNMSADDLYFEAGGWVPPCSNNMSDIDMMLEYDVDEVLSY